MGKRKTLFMPKKAKKVKAKRNSESSAETEHRLAQSREYKKLLRDNESPNDKATRLEKKCIEMAYSRAKETPDAKYARQEKNRVTSAYSRKLKSLDQRDVIRETCQSSAKYETIECNSISNSTSTAMSHALPTTAANSITHSSPRLYPIAVSTPMLYTSNVTASSIAQVSSTNVIDHTLSAPVASKITFSRVTVTKSATSTSIISSSNDAKSSTTRVSPTATIDHTPSTTVLVSSAMSSSMKLASLCCNRMMLPHLWCKLPL